MRKGNVNNDKFKVSKLVIIGTFFLFLLLIGRLCYLCLVDYKVGNSTIAAFIKNRNTKEDIIMPKRGTIYDINGNVLANDVVSYTLIAYLSNERVDAKGNKNYVEDIDDTSTKLAGVLGVTSEEIKDVLVKGKESNKYQVEFGTIGKGLSELTKEEIDKLKLQGIDFLKDIKRYYPNGDFASYILGYTVLKEDDDKNKWITGELGLEEYYNDELKGKSGYITYERDKYGYKIANGREYTEPADNGDDVYLTIDNNIQLFIESAVKTAQNDSEAEWVVMAAMDAKTGKILGYSSTPSFDPNLRNMTSYIDPIATLTYEPGSTMKIFSYMCAVDSGNYDGNTKYMSGSKTYTGEDGKETTINDWKKEGWGELTYDQGFALSSNIAVANIVESTINKDDLKACYLKYGFGSKTGFTMNREEAGSIDYTYQIEAATAGYGQGITTTPIQHLQALTIISNNGTMLKPYIIDKIVDTDTGKTIYKGKSKKVGTVVSSTTVTKMKELMASVINGDNTNSTGYLYHMDGYSLIGKTGTAQIYDYTKGKYMSGESDYIYSFSGMFPGDNPEIILYAAIKRPKDTTNYLAEAVKNVVVNTSKYLNIINENEDNITYKVGNYLNKDLTIVSNELKKHGIETIVLGNGSKIVGQYPNKGVTLYGKGKVIILTDNYDKKMIDLKGLSYKEAINTLKLMGVSYETEGTGYVYEQSISPDTIVNSGDIVNIKLRSNYSDS